MIIHLLEKLNRCKIILASKSPRRKQILTQLGLKFTVMESQFDENLDKTKFKNPADYVMETAKQKAIHVSSKNDSDIVIGADTIVVLDGKILEKPLNKKHAKEMLERLSNREHYVYTGVALVLHQNKIVTFFEETKVQFAKLTNELIEAYVETGEPM
jgi:MAF protein